MKALKFFVSVTIIAVQCSSSNFSYSPYTPDPLLDVCQRPTHNSTIPPVCACYVQVATDTRGPLGIIDCSGRGLTEIPRTIPSQLNYEEWDSAGKYKLKKTADISYLWLQGNEIDIIGADSFRNISNSVTTIYVNDNPTLSSIEPGAFSNMTNLTHLLLHYSGVQTIRNNTFVGAPNVEILWLHNNEIAELEEDAFTGLGGHLKELTLGGNNIGGLKAGQFDGLTHLRVLQLSQNMSDVSCDAICDVPTTASIQTADCSASCIVTDIQHCGKNCNGNAVDTCQGRDMFACCSDDSLDKTTGNCSDLPPVFPYEKGVDQSCHSFKSYDNACIDRTFGAGVRLTGSIAGVIIATVVGASFLLF